MSPAHVSGMWHLSDTGISDIAIPRRCFSFQTGDSKDDRCFGGFDKGSKRCEGLSEASFSLKPNGRTLDMRCMRQM